MTNFERWKTNLTIDDILVPVGDDINPQKRIHLGCENCPALDTCGLVWYLNDVEGADDPVTDCEKEFLKWARKEVEETKCATKCQ